MAAAVPATSSPVPRPLARWAPWLLAAILAAALGLRVYGLLTIPIAGDESIYLRWAEIILHQKQWFVSLLDGKQPLSYWLYALSCILWQGDPLLAGRLVSVAAGLLSTLGIFAIGRRLAGEAAGLAAAFLYAFCPYALLYDRLAYTESLVNLAGVAIVYASIVCFQKPGDSWKRALAPGLALGLGYLLKSTVVLFAFFPLLAVIWFKRQSGAKVVLGCLAVVYGVALVFPLISWAATPRAPMTPMRSLVLHRPGFFITPHELVRNPLMVAPGNLRLLADYLGAYLTLPLCVAALAALAYLGYKRSTSALLVSSASWLPLLAQVFVLQKIFPTRFPFPHIWPWLLVVGMAGAALWNDEYAGKSRRIARAAVGLLAVVIAGPLILKAICVVSTPEKCLYIDDTRNFLGSGPSAGFGAREAADYLIAETRTGPLTVFTDPIWGPPADAMFVYLNHRFGIRVYEAWWMTISPHHPIVPPVPVELVKSHYERVPGGVLVPTQLGRIYYVTERDYNSPAAVRTREPAAQQVASFLKPNRRNSIDIYRLR